MHEEVVHVRHKPPSSAPHLSQQAALLDKNMASSRICTFLVSWFLKLSIAFALVQGSDLKIQQAARSEPRINRAFQSCGVQSSASHRSFKTSDVQAWRSHERIYLLSIWFKDPAS
jgi:hypothetical protein